MPPNQFRAAPCDGRLVIHAVLTAVLAAFGHYLARRRTDEEVERRALPGCPDGSARVS